MARSIFFFVSMLCLFAYARAGCKCDILLSLREKGELSGPAVPAEITTYVGQNYPHYFVTQEMVKGLSYGVTARVLQRTNNNELLSTATCQNTRFQVDYHVCQAATYYGQTLALRAACSRESLLRDHIFNIEPVYGSNPVVHKVEIAPKVQLEAQISNCVAV